MRRLPPEDVEKHLEEFEAEQGRYGKEQGPLCPWLRVRAIVGDVVASKRKLEAAIARIKGGVVTLLMLLIVLYCIALFSACLIGVLLFLLWVFGVL